MVTKIDSLKQLPYKHFNGYVLKEETDTAFVGDGIAYMFISTSPKCIFLFVEAKIEDILGNN